MEEILNIEYHKHQLVVKALNKMPTKIRAAMALGIPERSLYKLIHQYSIKMNAAGKYYSKQITKTGPDGQPVL